MRLSLKFSLLLKLHKPLLLSEGSGTLGLLFGKFLSLTLKTVVVGLNGSQLLLNSGQLNLELVKFTLRLHNQSFHLSLFSIEVVLEPVQCQLVLGSGHLLVVLHLRTLSLYSLLGRVELPPEVRYLLLLVPQRGLEGLHLVVFSINVLLQLVVSLLSHREPLVQLRQLALFLLHSSSELDLLAAYMLLQRRKGYSTLLEVPLVLVGLLQHGRLLVDLLLDIFAQILRVLLEHIDGLLQLISAIFHLTLMLVLSGGQLSFAF